MSYCIDYLYNRIKQLPGKKTSIALSTEAIKQDVDACNTFQAVYILEEKHREELQQTVHIINPISNFNCAQLKTLVRQHHKL